MYRQTFASHGSRACTALLWQKTVKAHIQDRVFRISVVDSRIFEVLLHYDTKKSNIHFVSKNIGVPYHWESPAFLIPVKRVPTQHVLSVTVRRNGRDLGTATTYTVDG